MSTPRRGKVERSEGVRREYRLRWSHRAESPRCPMRDASSPNSPIPELREVFVRTYRIVYRIHESDVQIITVFEGHRLFPTDVSLEGDPAEGE